VVAVVVLPDNAWKYLSSFRRHLPDLFPEEQEAGPAATPANPYAAHLESAFALAKQGPDVIDVAEARRLQEEGVTILDVRNPDEVARVQIPSSLTLPLPELSAGSLRGLPDDRTTPLVTICAAGTRSLYALLLLKAQGYADVKSVDGGIGAWVDAGLPTG
jgi:rhodanese-related sulfurtransferase